MKKYFKSIMNPNLFVINENSQNYQIKLINFELIKEPFPTKEELIEYSKDEFTLNLAKYISKIVHKGQVDKGNIDYFSGHVQTVVDTVRTNNEKIVAYLHDSIEDTNLDLNSLNNAFDKEIIEAISVITKDRKIDYIKYIKSVKSNQLAKKVKIADLKNNSDLSRLSTVTEKDLQRIEKYKKALNILMK